MKVSFYISTLVFLHILKYLHKHFSWFWPCLISYESMRYHFYVPAKLRNSILNSGCDNSQRWILKTMLRPVHFKQNKSKQSNKKKRTHLNLSNPKLTLPVWTRCSLIVACEGCKWYIQFLCGVTLNEKHWWQTTMGSNIIHINAVFYKKTQTLLNVSTKAIPLGPHTNTLSEISGTFLTNINRLMWCCT